MRITKANAGLAAIVLLAPGGFLLGAALAARAWRKRGVTPPTEPTDGPVVS